MSLYGILGLGAHAEDLEIRQAFRKLALRWVGGTLGTLTWL